VLFKITRFKEIGMQEESRFTIHLEQQQSYEFKVKFDWDDTSDMVMDEPAPLGRQSGPNAARLVAAATANCLSASLLFCLHKTDAPPERLRARATCVLGRNERKRLRISELHISIVLEDASGYNHARLNRCLEMFEDFCVVTSSLREGIPIQVDVLDKEGNTLHRG
jgi:organic hydroperoxide reductase OsmC/OhrA